MWGWCCSLNTNPTSTERVSGQGSAAASAGRDRRQRPRASPVEAGDLAAGDDDVAGRGVVVPPDGVPAASRAPLPGGGLCPATVGPRPKGALVRRRARVSGLISIS